MGLMRIGALSVVLSDVLVSGLTTGASMHILTSQIKGIFGVNVPRQTQFPKMIRVSAARHMLRHIRSDGLTAVDDHG
jgi:MFS superfamily sulfate permease-like transporter